MKSGEFVRLLLSRGWYIVRQRGSHLILRHKKSKEQLSVPIHAAHEIGKGLQKRIEKQALKQNWLQDEEN